MVMVKLTCLLWFWINSISTLIANNFKSQLLVWPRSSKFLPKRNKRRWDIRSSSSLTRNRYTKSRGGHFPSMLHIFLHHETCVDGIYHIINHAFLWEHNELKGKRTNPNPVSPTTYWAIRTDLYGSLVGRGFLSLRRFFSNRFFLLCWKNSYQVRIRF
jgi:hypothetical protein